MHGAFTVEQLTGMQPMASNYQQRGTMEAGATAEHEGLGGTLHPDNPMLWLGGILAVTVGLIGFSGSVRVGKSRATVSVDKDKA